MRYMLFILLALGLYSCKKQEQPTKGPDCSHTETRYISAEISHFKFKQGTYWVFMDSVSMTIDTLKVETVLLSELRPYQYCPNNYHEYYSFEINEINPQSNSRNSYYLLDETGLKLNPTSENYPALYTNGMPKIDSVFIFDRYYKQVAQINSGQAGNNTVSYINTAEGFLKKEIYSNNQLISKKLLKSKYIIR